MATTFDRAKLDTGALDIKPLTPAIGAEIHSIDLSSAETARRIPEIRAALLKYGVIFFVTKTSRRNSTSPLRGNLANWKSIPPLPKINLIPKSCASPTVLKAGGRKTIGIPM